MRSNTFTEAAAEAARQKQVHSLHKTKFTLAIMLDSVKHRFFVNVLQAQAAARAAEFEAAALAWLTEPSAPTLFFRIMTIPFHLQSVRNTYNMTVSPYADVLCLLVQSSRCQHDAW